MRRLLGRHATTMRRLLFAVEAWSSGKPSSHPGFLKEWLRLSPGIRSSRAAKILRAVLGHATPSLLRHRYCAMLLRHPAWVTPSPPAFGSRWGRQLRRIAVAGAGLGQGAWGSQAVFARSAPRRLRLTGWRQEKPMGCDAMPPAFGSRRSSRAAGEARSSFRSRLNRPASGDAFGRLLRSSGEAVATGEA